MIPFEPSTAIPAKQWAAPELKPANHTSKWPHHQSKNPVPFVEWGKVAAVAPEGSCTVSLKNRNWEDEVEPDIIIGANYELYIK